MNDTQMEQFNELEEKVEIYFYLEKTALELIAMMGIFSIWLALIFVINHFTNDFITWFIIVLELLAFIGIGAFYYRRKDIQNNVKNLFAKTKEKWTNNLNRQTDTIETKRWKDGVELALENEKYMKFIQKCNPTEISIVNANYIGDFKFIVHFSNGKIKEVDIKRVADVDSRYGELESFKVLEDENFVKNMKIEGPTLSYENIDIAPEILYQVAIMSEEHDEYEEIAKIIKERVTDRQEPAVMISH